MKNQNFLLKIPKIVEIRNGHLPIFLGELKTNRGLDKLELLRIVEVANEKSIDKELVIGSVNLFKKRRLGLKIQLKLLLIEKAGKLKFKKFSILLKG